MSRSGALYSRLPVSLQNVAVSGYGLWWKHRRLGGAHARYRSEYLEREHQSHEGWKAWQTARLRHIAGLASESPHYRRAFDEHGLGARAIATIELADLASLPVTTKEQVRRSPDAFIVGRRGAGSFFGTGGTTGTPLQIYYSVNDLRRSEALRSARYRGAAGVDYGDRRATIGGRMVVADPQADGPYHRYNAAERQIYLSAFHLRADTVEQYAAALRRHRIQWLRGNASAIGELARLLLACEIPGPQLRAVVTIAEPATERLRGDVLAAFGCRVTEEYGLVEEVCYALECEQGALHASPDAGIIEILGEDDRGCGEGEVGEIVATGFVREAQPFLRYRTGDLGALSSATCGCGRSMPVIEALAGRIDDSVITADGRRISRLTPVFVGLDGVVAAQIAQRAQRLSVRLVMDRPLERSLADVVRDRLGLRVGPGMSIEVERVETLSRTSAGKVKAVVREGEHE